MALLRGGTVRPYCEPARMVTRVLAIAVLTLSSAASVCADIGEPTWLIARHAQALPVVDGDLGDPVWAQAPVSDTWRVIQPGTATTGPVLRAAWTAEELILALETPTVAEVALVIDPDRDLRGGVVIRLSQVGYLGMELVAPPGPIGFREDSVRAAVAATVAGWSAEVALPWAALGLSPERVGVIGFDAILRGAEGQGSARWSTAGTTADPDLAAVGALVLDDNPVRLERVTWGGLHLDQGRVEAVIRNAGPTKANLSIDLETASPYAQSERSSQVVFLAPYQRLTVSLPVRSSMPGRGRLSVRLREGGAGGRTLFRGVAEYTSDDRFRVEGIGWLSLSLKHRLAGRTPIEARLQAVECRPHPASQPPVVLETSLVGPLGPGERRQFIERRSLEAIELATLQHRFAYRSEDLLAGDYAVEVVVLRGGTTLAAARHLVRVSQLTERSLGITPPTETLESLQMGAASAPPTDAVRRGTAALVYRLGRAWQLYERADVSTPDALRERYAAIRAEAAEAERVASHLRAGERPYGKESGVFLMAHWSEVDDTAQPYGLYVPDTYADTRGAGLVLVLHGYDGGNSGFGFPTDPNDSYYLSARERGWLVAWPWGRGNQDWRDSGETDLYDLIEEIKALYSVDPARIYLAGISMGGRGVWHHAARRPDVWAGVVPIAGASSGQVWTVWEEERLAPNLRNLPSYILHGAKDDVVPVEDARTMYRSLMELGYPVEYEEHPTRGHEGFGDAIPRVFQWMDEHRLDPWPRHVTYATEWLRWAKAYWVVIEGLAASGRLSQVDARLEGGNRLAVATDGITAFGLELSGHPDVDMRAPLHLEVDGAPAWSGFLPPRGDLHFVRRDGEWVEAPASLLGADDPPVKSRYVSGPMRRIFCEPFSLVYGTHGWDDARLLASYTMARNTAERWEWWMWGQVDPRPDTELGSEELGRGGLLVYGGPDMNVVARGLTVPAGWDPGAIVKSAEPNPWNQRYLAAVFAAPDADTLHGVGTLGELWPLPAVPFAAQDADFQVAQADGEGRLRPTAEGSYDAAWGVPDLAPGVWVFSDHHWRASHLADEGWTEATYDDSAWQAPIVRLRKEFDDSCWHYAAIHKYGRLAQSFEHPAMALSLRDDESTWQHVTHFRRVFNLDRAPSAANLWVYLDDEGEVYLNGSLAASLSVDDRVTDLDVTPWLREGPNVIAIQLRNREYDECLCLELHVAP